MARRAIIQRVITPLAVVLLLSGGCAGDPEQKRSAAAPRPDVTAAVLHIEKNWRRDLGKGAGLRFIRLEVTVAADRVYAAEAEGHVRAMAAESGRTLWARRIRGPLSAGVSVGSGHVYVVTGKGVLHALDAATGRRMWATALPGEVLTRPVPYEGGLVVQCANGTLFALDAKTGQPRWRNEITEPALSLYGTGVPLIAGGNPGGRVLAGYANGRMAAYDLDTGRSLWETEVAAPQGRSEVDRLVDLDAQAVVSDGLAYVATWQGKLVALNLEDGRVVWSRPLPIHNGLAVDQAQLYIADAQGVVHALDPDSGEVIWTQDRLKGRQMTAPFVSGEHVVLGDDHGYTIWLTRARGEVVGVHRMSHGALLVPPTGEGNAIYVSDQNGRVAALTVKSASNQSPR